jgi:hypothetical protein
MLLGVNHRKPPLAGFNSRDYKKLWHRGATCPEFPAPCDLSVATADDDIVHPLDGALLWLPGFRDTVPDKRGQGVNATVVSLDNNVAVPLLFAALARRAEETAYMDCLQGQGAVLPHPVCRYNRPLSQRLGKEDTDLDNTRPRFQGIWTAEQSATLPPPPPPLPVLLDPLGAPFGAGAASPAAATPPAVGATVGVPVTGSMAFADDL